MCHANVIAVIVISLLVTIAVLANYSQIDSYQSQDKAIADNNRIRPTNRSLFRTVSKTVRYTFHPLHSSGSEHNNTRGTTIAERSFNISDHILSSIGFPLNLSGVTSLTASGFDQFVFVTAASATHFHEGMDAVARVQQHFPNHTLYFYDLDTNTRQGTINKLKALCNVVYRPFNNNRLPRHVRELITYAFKPIIIHEVLLEHKTLFWIDSSIRFEEKLDSIRDQTVNESRGVLLFDYTGHSIFAATHETMFKYLPMSMSAAINVSMMGANAIYIHCSQQLYDAVIRWWVLCALEPSCISPTRNLGCNFNGHPRDRYAGCHRFDQSALSILLGNYFDNNFAKYSCRHNVLRVVRGSFYVEQLRVCDAHGSVISSLKSSSYF